jgi:AcrR family transcriptional regulator
MLTFTNSRSQAGPMARKQPRQRRSHDTVSVILQAATRVFAQRGYQRATTNQVAARAGVSIGSLYQYFPNKVAIAAALETRHLDAAEPQLLDLARRLRAAGTPIDTWVERFVGALVTANDEPHHRELYAAVPRTAAVQARLESLVDGLAAELAPLLAGRSAVPRARLAIVAALTLVHELVIPASAAQRRAMIREVVRMVSGYLRSEQRQHRGCARRAQDERADDRGGA